MRKDSWSCACSATLRPRAFGCLSFRLVRFDRGPFSYKPGEPLADFMLHFDRAPAKEDRDDEDSRSACGAAYRLRQSACFEKSGGALLCTTCHDPHDIRHGEEAVPALIRRCAVNVMALHSRQTGCIGRPYAIERLHRMPHAQAPHGRRCPRRLMTDHYIQRRKPQRDLLAPIQERRETDDRAYHGNGLCCNLIRKIFPTARIANCIAPSHR